MSHVLFRALIRVLVFDILWIASGYSQICSGCIEPICTLLARGLPVMCMLVTKAWPSRMQVSCHVSGRHESAKYIQLFPGSGKLHKQIHLLLNIIYKITRTLSIREFNKCLWWIRNSYYLLFIKSFAMLTAHTHTHTHTHTHRHTHTHTHIPTYWYIHTYTHACAYTYMPTYIHTYVHTYMSTHTQTHTHTHTHTHIYIYIHIHVYTHTCTHTYIRT
jgi:hypothetical protein